MPHLNGILVAKREEFVLFDDKVMNDTGSRGRGGEGVLQGYPCSAWVLNSIKYTMGIYLNDFEVFDDVHFPFISFKSLSDISTNI